MNNNALTEEERQASISAFEKLGLCHELAEAAAGLGWKGPTTVQEQTIPLLLEGG